MKNSIQDLIIDERSLLRKNLHHILFVISSLLMFKSLLFAILTIAIAAKVLVPLLIEKTKHMKIFYGQSNLEILTPRDKLIIASEIGSLGFVAVMLSCPISNNKIYILLSLGMFYLSFWFFKREMFGDLSNTIGIRKAYFKHSLIIGIIYSTITLFIDPNISWGKAAWKATHINSLCDAISLLNKISEFIAGQFPFLIKHIIRIVFNANVASGFLFSLYVLFILQLTTIRTEKLFPLEGSSESPISTSREEE